jgi:hypothetical protein
MDLAQATAKLLFLSVRLRIVPREPLYLPALSKGNTLRGAFGTAFRRLVCIPQCREARHCPLDGTCPYRIIFEPSPPPGASRLSKNQDIPRPFIFRPPLDVETSGASAAAPAVQSGGAAKTRYNPGEAFDFTLIVVGKAVDYLPYFILAFREVAREGIGLNRAHCELTEVRATNPVAESGSAESRATRPESPNHESWSRNGDTAAQLVYSSGDELFRTPRASTVGDYVQARLAQLSTVDCQLSTVDYKLSAAARGTSPLSTVHFSLSTAFLTPTYLKSEGQAVRRPEFHHLFKRVRDRLNAICTFYGPGPIDADFKGLGAAAEKVRTLQSDVHWQERSRRSSKTGQRHEISGFVGNCVYEFPSESAISNFELLKWLIAGELLHAGRHTAWGNGWYGVITEG